ncbi:MAG: hypothetical protein WCA46_25525 [Actinocatenispora sp.]
MYRSRDGRWTVEHITGSRPDGHGDGELLRVCHRGHQVALCDTVEQVADLVSLVDLELVDDSERFRVPATRVPS